MQNQINAQVKEFLDQLLTDLISNYLETRDVKKPLGQLMSKDDFMANVKKFNDAERASKIAYNAKVDAEVTEYVARVFGLDYIDTMLNELQERFAEKVKASPLGSNGSEWRTWWAFDEHVTYDDFCKLQLYVARVRKDVIFSFDVRDFKCGNKEGGIYLSKFSFYESIGLDWRKIKLEKV